MGLEGKPIHFAMSDIGRFTWVLLGKDEGCKIHIWAHQQLEVHLQETLGARGPVEKDFKDDMML